MNKIEPNQRPSLQKGTRGEWVVFLQDVLNGCKCNPLDLDGDFGDLTENEVKLFQKEVGLTVNGEVDTNTWTALDQHEKLFGWQCEWPSQSSLTGIGGADTLENVTADMISKAATFMGNSPRFWGRYFQGNSNEGEYLHNKENKPLHDKQIRVLPISRRTRMVGGTKEQGNEIGSSHAKDVILTFGEDYLASSQGDGLYFFLDVEGQPSLSKEFYLGWSEAILKASSKVKLLPCLYLSAKQDPTSKQNLGAAMRAGAQCHGLWVANYGHQITKIRPWDRDQSAPATPVPCKVLIHQYAGDINNNGVPADKTENGVYDFSQINPFLDDPELVLKRLILPPA
ncbi:family 24 glycoside hydrolase [Calothrix brevissima NIES-22]|nr:family 24 glycoside hydrolase [Calothrix brevissima NIES-22]